VRQRILNIIPNQKWPYMLKDKMNQLVLGDYRPGKDCFEIITDSDAMNLRGGEGCNKLQSCLGFNGTCPNLEDCTNYTCMLG
jgi:hypothetical protein